MSSPIQLSLACQLKHRMAWSYFSLRSFMILHGSLPSLHYFLGLTSANMSYKYFMPMFQSLICIYLLTLCLPLHLCLLPKRYESQGNSSLLPLYFLGRTLWLFQSSYSCTDLWHPLYPLPLSRALLLIIRSLRNLAISAIFIYQILDQDHQQIVYKVHMTLYLRALSDHLMD